MEILNEYQQREFLKLLLEAYTLRRETNNAFSMRAFSKKIEISSGSLSEIFQNKRRVTILTARKVLKNLNHSPYSIENFVETKKGNKKIEDRGYQELSIDQYKGLSY